MITRDELARELSNEFWGNSVWWDLFKHEKIDWLRVADRALELLKGEGV